MHEEDVPAYLQADAEQADADPELMQVDGQVPSTTQGEGAAATALSTGLLPGGIDLSAAAGATDAALSVPKPKKKFAIPTTAAVKQAASDSMQMAKKATLCAFADDKDKSAKRRRKNEEAHEEERRNCFQVFLRSDRTRTMRIDLRESAHLIYVNASRVMEMTHAGALDHFYITVGGKIFPNSETPAGQVLPLLQKETTLCVHHRGGRSHLREMKLIVKLGDGELSVYHPLQHLGSDEQDKQAYLTALTGALHVSPKAVTCIEASSKYRVYQLSTLAHEHSSKDIQLLEEVARVIEAREVTPSSESSEVICRWQALVTCCQKKCICLLAVGLPCGGKTATLLKQACTKFPQSLTWLIPAPLADADLCASLDLTDFDGDPAGACKGGHPLVRFSTPRSGYNCDQCSIRVPSGTVIYGCRKCDFDLCEACFLKKQHDGHASLRNHALCTLARSFFSPAAPKVPADIFYILLGAFIRKLVRLTVRVGHVDGSKTTDCEIATSSASFGLDERWKYLCLAFFTHKWDKPKHEKLLAFLEEETKARPMFVHTIGEIFKGMLCAPVKIKADRLAHVYDRFGLHLTRVMRGKLLEHAISHKNGDAVTFLLAHNFPVTSTALSVLEETGSPDLALEVGASARKAGAFVHMRIKLVAMCSKLLQGLGGLDDENDEREPTVRINLSKLVPDSVRFLKDASAKTLCQLPVIEFSRIDQQGTALVGAEMGIDEGGLLRQWMSSCSEALVLKKGKKSSETGCISIPACAADTARDAELADAVKLLMESMGVPVDEEKDLKDQELACLLKVISMSIIHGIPLGFRIAQYVSAQLIGEGYEPVAALSEMDPGLASTLLGMKTSDGLASFDVSQFLLDVCGSATTPLTARTAAEQHLLLRVQAHFPVQMCALCHTRPGANVCHVCSVLSPEMSQALVASVMDVNEDNAPPPFYLSSPAEVDILVKLIGEARYPPIHTTALKQFHDCVPSLVCASLLSAEELSAAVSGIALEDIVSIWKANVSWRRIGGDTEGHPRPNLQNWFWKVVAKHPVRCLQFCTGLTSLNRSDPFQGRGFEITVRPEQGNQHFPAVHTCSFDMDLPEYTSEEHLEFKLLAALDHGDGFGFA